MGRAQLFLSNSTHLNFIPYSQYYLPPENMINKDFIKMVLIGEKQLVKMEELKPINLPSYDEISVKQLYT